MRDMHWRKFVNGIAEMSVFTADDCIAILQQIPYVVGTGTKIIPDLVKREHDTGKKDPITGDSIMITELVNCNEAFVKACKCVLEILSILKKRQVTKDNLEQLDRGWCLKRV